MRRRDFIAGLGGVAAMPFAARAQPTKQTPRIGLLVFGGEAEFGRFVQAFKDGMAERGYEDRRNIQFDVRYSGQDREQLARNARELVAASMDLIWVPGSTTAQAAREATAVIPIVFAIVADPVHSGFVKSLASPGTNLTGLSLLTAEMWEKRLEILLEVRSDIRRLAVLAEPDEPASAAQLPHIRRAAATLRKELLVVEANSIEQFSLAFSKFKEWQADALVLAESGLFLFHRRMLIEQAIRYRWPTVNSSRQYAEVGGLMSYGVDYVDSCRRSTEYVARILKGAKPADLPVQQPTKFEFVINLKTAHALGIEIPPILLARADEVIE